VVGKEAIVHLIEDDVYLDIEFLSWDQEGGGFSYRRATEGTPGEKVWTGQPMTFSTTRLWLDPANQDRITDNVWITRKHKEGIFNFVRDAGGRLAPPSGTEWADGRAADYETLTFTGWRDWARSGNRRTPDIVGVDAVVHLIEDDVYLDIKFTSWTQGRSPGTGGGGFSYERATEGVFGEMVWTGPTTTFTKADNADWTDPANQDRITDSVRITRRTERGLINLAREITFRPEWSPPSGTEWAYGSAADYQTLGFGSWKDLFERDRPNTPEFVGRDLVVHLIEDDVYIDIKFTSWAVGGAGGQGGFSYERATEGTPGEMVWTGAKTTFTKADGADWTQAANQDRITQNVWITRQDNQGIFNIAAEPSWDGTQPPAGTEWADGNAADWATLSFQSWRNWARSHGQTPDMVGVDAVVHLIQEDVYIDIKFLSWTQGRSPGTGGGGFAYQRATEGTPGEKVWTGPNLTFIKNDNADWSDAANQDRITDDVWITRKDEEGIFNIAKEPAYRYNRQPWPPTGTEWAWGSAADWEKLTFFPWRTWHGRNPPSSVGRQAVLHLIEDNIYLDIVFTGWQESGGGGFSYMRGFNSLPEITTGPTANPGIAAIGEDVMFDVAATDFNGDPLTFIWDFGDGAAGAGTSTTHDYTAAGRYTTTVDVRDGLASTMGTVDVVVAAPMAVDKFKGKLNFKKPDKDGLNVKGSLDLDQGFAPDGVAFRVDVGGAAAEFTLDAKGKAKTETGKLKLKFKKKTGLWEFNVKLKKSDFADAWADEGLVNETKE
jgi:hypothetical protein